MGRVGSEKRLESRVTVVRVRNRKRYPDDCNTLRSDQKNELYRGIVPLISIN